MWFMLNTARTMGPGLTQWENFAVERIPVPKISPAQQRPFIRLVDRITATKAADPAADTGGLEEEVDGLVYDLYGLTEEERAVVDAGEPPSGREPAAAGAEAVIQ